MTTEQATRAAIVSAVRAFVQNVEDRATISRRPRERFKDAIHRALYDELAALERAAAAEGAPEGNAHE